MLGMGFLSYILFAFFSFYCNSQVAHSRSSPSSSKTTVLNVSASIQTTLRAMSLEGTTASRTAHALSQQDRSSLSVLLHYRISLHAPTHSHSDYKSLTLARLERDSAQVRSLTARLDLATSDLKPIVTGNEFQLEAEDFEGPIISRMSQGSGEYFSRVRIEKPPSQAYVVLDTGNDVSWVQCAPCADCYQQADSIFESASSTSFSPLLCESQQCMSLDVFDCRNETCLFEVAYDDGSYIVSDFVTETISFGGASAKEIAIDCGHTNEGLFVGAAELLGL